MANKNSISNENFEYFSEIQYCCSYTYQTKLPYGSKMVNKVTTCKNTTVDKIVMMSGIIASTLGYHFWGAVLHQYIGDFLFHYLAQHGDSLFHYLAQHHYHLELL